MIKIVGDKREAKIMVPDEKYLESYARSQIEMICNYNYANIGFGVVVMPDVHPGKVGPIGLSMRLIDVPGRKLEILPALLGPDIGCGVSMVRINKVKKEFQKIDTVIRDNIPSGSSKRSKYIYWYDFPYKFESYLVSKEVIYQNIGTLGGGNHFIELDQDPETEQVYLTVHSGSRAIGRLIYEDYMTRGQKFYKETFEMDIPYEISPVIDKLAENYRHDAALCTKIAADNREAIIRIICKEMKWKMDSKILSCPHNFISNGILRKGAIEARKRQDVVIPINSRDGIILGEGKGNPEWNLSAPHGSGRIIKRNEVANQHTLSEYKKIMKENNIYSPSISKDTLDEAPFAYRDLEYLLSTNLDETIKIKKILKPIYNFKAGDN